MKYFLILVIGLIVILFGNHIITSESEDPKTIILGYDSNDSISPVNSTNIEVLEKSDYLVDIPSVVPEPSLTPIIDSSKVTPVKEKEYVEITKYEESYIKHKQNEIKSQILRLGKDVQNREMQLELSSSLEEAAEYRENILIKAKQEMLKQGEI